MLQRSIDLHLCALQTAATVGGQQWPLDDAVADGGMLVGQLILWTSGQMPFRPRIDPFWDEVLGDDEDEEKMKIGGSRDNFGKGLVVCPL